MILPRIPPLIFAVHRINGYLSPCLYHDDRLPRVHDEVVYSLRLDRLDWPAISDLAPGDLLELFWEGYFNHELPPSEAVRKTRNQ